MPFKQLTKKRQQFHSKIRSQYIQIYMNKARYQLHQQHVTASLRVLNELIEFTTESINKKQLVQLIWYANEMDENNAIIHIGNLIIDGVVTMSDMFSCVKELKLGESRYWLWLVRVILNTCVECYNSNNLYKQWQSKAITYVMNKLVTTQLTFSLTESLEIIKHLLTSSTSTTSSTKQHTIHWLITHHPGVLIKIKDCCLHFDKRVSQLSYQLIDQIISLGDYPTIQLIKITSLTQIQRVLMLGFNKLDHTQRKFPLIICRMVNNIFSSGVKTSEGILRAVVNRCLNSDNSQRVRVEFSYLWLSFCQTCTVRELETALQCKLLQALETVIGNGESINNNNSSNFKHTQTIAKNISSILSTILAKSQFMNSQKSQLINNSIHLMADQFGLTISHMYYGQTTSQYIPQSNNQNVIYQPQHLSSSQSGMDIQ